MGPLRRFLRLRPADRRVLLFALLAVWTVRLGLWLLPFRVLRDLLARLTRQQPATAEASPQVVVGRVVWGVCTAARYVPSATCLTQALAAKVLLVRHGQPATVRIGVARGAAGQLQAHAWVEAYGNVLIGGSESSLSGYTRLGASDGEIW